MENIQNIVENGFCTGCCECIGSCTHNNISFMWSKKFGHPIPTVDDSCEHCGKCVEACKKEIKSVSVSAG